MSIRMNRSLLSVSLALVLGVGGCVRKPPPMTDTERPLTHDEEIAYLEEQGAEFDAEIERSGVVLADPVVQEYVDGIARRLRPEGVADDVFRIRVVRSPSLFGFALPHGSIYLSVGLLYAVRSEAELSQVMGHEMAHVVQRHSLAALRDRRAKGVAVQLTDMATLGIAGGVAQVSYLLSVTSYSRAAEAEADELGLRAVVGAGYDATAAVGFYETLRASALAEVNETGGAFATHPTLSARSENLEELLRAGEIESGRDARVGTAEQAAIHGRIAGEYLRLLYVYRLYERLSEETTALLERDGEDSTLLCARGDAWRGMAEDPEAVALERASRRAVAPTDEMIAEVRAKKDEFVASAVADYERCRELDRADPRAWRGIGMVAWSSGDADQARPALQQYLELEPWADDRRYIQSILAADGEGEQP